MRRKLFVLRWACARRGGGRISMLFRLLFVPLSSSSSPLSDLLIESRPQFPPPFSIFSLFSLSSAFALFIGLSGQNILLMSFRAEIETAPSSHGSIPPSFSCCCLFRNLSALMPSLLFPLSAQKWRVVSYLSVHSRFMGTRLRRKCRLHHFCPLLSAESQSGR